jgi:hypothetical protein
MVLRFCKVDGEFTDPLLVITSPIATHFLCALQPTRKLLELSDDDPLPLTQGLSIPTDPPATPADSDCTPPTLPDTLSPTSVSLMPCPRPWIEKTHGSQLLPSARSEGNFATIPLTLWTFFKVFASFTLGSGKANPTPTCLHFGPQQPSWKMALSLILIFLVDGLKLVLSLQIPTLPPIGLHHYFLWMLRAYPLRNTCLLLPMKL